MYESPITQFVDKTLTQIIKTEEDNLVYEVQQAISYEINKEELIKALKYDRDQYQKGYEDGRKSNEWTSLTRDTLPKEGEDVLIQYKSNGEDYMAVSRRIDYNFWCGFGRDICVIAWRNLPEPYKG